MPHPILLTLLLVWGPLFLTFVWITLVLNPTTYHWTIHGLRTAREFTVIEMATAALFLVCAIGASYLTVVYTLDKRLWLTRLAFAGLAVIAFTVAMEEVQWLHPILHYDIPSLIADSNRQKEMTLHNIEGVHGHDKRFYLVFCAAGFALYVRRIWPFPAELSADLRPHNDLRAMLWLVLIVVTAMMLCNKFFGNPWAPLKPLRWTQEVIELCIAYWSAAYVTIKCAQWHQHLPQPMAEH